MGKNGAAAVFLSLLMLSGCFGSGDSNADVEPEDTVAMPYTIEASWDQEIVTGEIGEISELNILLETTGEGSYTMEYRISHSNEVENAAEWSVTEKETYISIILLPNAPGTYLIEVKILPSEGELITMTNAVEVQTPDEGTTSLIVPQYIVAESSMLFVQGQILHQSIESCFANITIPQGDFNLESYALSIQEDGTFNHMLSELDFRNESFIIAIYAQCGIYTMSEDFGNTTIIIEANNDADGDGILDEMDQCPDGIGESDGWASNQQNDIDQDGCRDFDEDIDDDNDGILDAKDGCVSTIGWTSTLSNDRDSDGCNDDTNDDDDDGDGIPDVDDSCQFGEVNWPANLYNDWDQDGCHDLVEDIDDDNDGSLDTDDFCQKGKSNWEDERNANTDFDMDGCYDLTEDEDDDNDSVNDVNATGADLDQCPFTPLGATDVDEF